MDRIVLVALGTVLLACSPASAQASQQDQSVFTEDWRWVEFGPESGIPSRRIFDLIETSEAVPWIVSDQGLAWYDGTLWRQVEVAGWSGSWKDCDLGADLQGGVLASDGKKLFQGDRHGLRVIDVPLEILRAVPISADEILIAAASGFFRYDGANLSPFPEPEGKPIAGGIKPVFRTREGHLWSRTMSGTYLWQDGSWLCIFDRSVGYVSLTESAGLLGGFGTPIAGLWTWSGPPGAPPARIAGDGVPAVQSMDAIAGGMGIARYISGRVRLREGGRWEWLQKVPLQIANARFVRLQSNGDLWAGGDEGLHLFRHVPRWERVRFAGPVGSNQINNLLLSSAGDLWVASSCGVFIRRANGLVESLPSIENQALGTVTGLCEDAAGGIWVSSGLDLEGAYRFHEGAWRHYSAADGLKAQLVHRVVKGESGRTWFLGISDRVGENEPGAFAFDGEDFVPWGLEQGLISGRVYGLVDAPNGEIWFATGLGLSRYRDRAWTHWTITSGLAKKRVFCLARGPEGRIWFGHTSGIAGLGYIDADDRVRYLSKADGLVGDNVKELRFDADGRLWIATERGLSSYSEGRFSSFQRAEGLDHPSLWPVLPADGVVYMGTVGGGVHILNLDEASNPPPRVQISAFPRDAGARLEWTTIAHRGALDPNRIETRHRLDGGAWSHWNRRRSLDLRELSPGAHEFTVQAKGLLGKIDPAGVSLEFRVPAPIYLHPLFVTLALFLGLGGLATAFVSARRRLRQRSLLEQSEERHRTLVEQIPIGIQELDLAGRVLSMNPAGLRMLGLHRENEIVGLDYLSLVAEEDRERLVDLFNKSMRGEVTEFEFTVLIEGHRRKFEAALEPIREENDSITRLMGYCLEITEREKAEKKRRLLEQQLQEAQKMQAVAVLAGGVAHDFNNLLTIIGGHAAMINAGPGKSDAVSRSSVEILKAQERAASLTRQLLTLGRRQPAKTQVIDLCQVVQEIEEMMRRLVGPEIDYKEDLSTEECRVLADPGQMEQVLMNLVVNARDAMPSGGSLLVSCARREYESASSVGGSPIDAGSYVLLSVRDTGVGLDEETRPRIFEPFFTTKGLEQGTGLGLSTIHGIVEEHGGRILVESEPGRGSCFSILLPSSQEPPVLMPTPEPTEKVQGGDETILLVDDDQPIRVLVKSTLEALGYRVLAAKDGVEALRLAAESVHPIHLLLTDVIMPRMGGRALTTAFSECFPDARVVFMTGYADSPDWKPSVPMLAKPFKSSELAALLRQTLDAVASPPLA